MRRRAWFFVVGLLGFVLITVAAGAARGKESSIAEGPSLFSISKSENKNQVAFAVRLGADCRPLGAAPVYAYWRMLENSPTAVEPLLPIEQSAYGLANQEVLEVLESGGVVRVTLRALPSREIVVRTGKKGGVCVAEASTRIANTPARLFNVHARIAWPFGVDSLLITGWAEADGRIVRETMRP